MYIPHIAAFELKNPLGEWSKCCEMPRIMAWLSELGKIERLGYVESGNKKGDAAGPTTFRLFNAWLRENVMAATPITTTAPAAKILGLTGFAPRLMSWKM